MNGKIKLPRPVAGIYKAAAELEFKYRPRRFTPDGRLLGSLGEVVAVEVLGLPLYTESHSRHHACDANGDVQIKMTVGTTVAMRAGCTRLVVLRILNPEEAEVVMMDRGRPLGDALARWGVTERT
jgi:hypothetical protein